MSDKIQDATPESLEYRTEVKQLLDILAHSLYTDREIFLRELVSNASDALNRIQFEMLTNQDVVDANAELAITIVCDPANHTLTIRDTGIGMNRDELVRNLGTIAHSGAKTFLQNAGEKQSTLEEIIGQFGVGFYSVFMVAERVSVTSRSCRPEDEAWQWSSSGDSTFTLAPAEKTTRGTEIVISLKEDAHEFAQAWRIESIIRKHSDYVSFPIYVETVHTSDEESSEESAAEETEETREPVNRRTALWRQSPSKVEEEEYNDFYKQLTFDVNDPLLHVHLVTDVPVHLRALLFVPAKRERTNLRLRTDHGLRLYSRKVLIQDHNKELLPEYLRFVEGVVDSEDLPLNVSREMVQSNPVMRQIRRALTGRIHKELKNLADSEDADEQKRYTSFWSEFGVFVKEGIAIDPASHETLVDLLRFHSSGVDAESLTSLKQYKERMIEGQKAIYYVLGEDLASVARSPHLDYFRKNKIEVLYLVDPIDGFVTSALPRFDDLPLQNVDSADLELPAATDEAEKEETEQSALEGEQFDEVVKRFIAVLGDRVKSVREAKLLVDSPCRLVSTDDAYDRDLQRFRRLTEENYETPKKVLEINRRHPTIAGLAHLIESNPGDPIIDAAIEQLFDNALLLEGLKANPVDMVARMQSILAAAVERRG